jgi:hypothetical protein
MIASSVIKLLNKYYHENGKTPWRERDIDLNGQ